MKTIQSEIGRLEQVIIKNPEAAFINQKKIDNEWEELFYLDRPDFVKAVNEFNQFKRIFSNFGIDVVLSTMNESLSIDSIYVRDSTFVCDSGVVLCRMGKDQRIPEAKEMLNTYEKLDIPILGEIEAPGKLEGGDIFWLDKQTIAVGLGYRTNMAGVEQLRELCKDSVDEIVIVPSPHWNGPSDVFHLMSVVSPIDSNLFLVYSRLLSVPFRQLLLERGIELIEVADEEYDSMAGNVLAIAPRVCIMIKGNPITKKRLIDAGATIYEYDGGEISFKGCGGPTCLTKPLWRNI